MLTFKHKQETSSLINKYIENDRWLDAKRILESELVTYPTEYWLLTTLSNVYYELRDYKKAFEFSEKALSIAPFDYLVLNNHACILSVLDGKENEAIKLLQRIIRSKLSKIAYGDHGEGMRWAKSLVNDSRVRLALVYLSNNEKTKALKYLNDHLENRERGVFSNFSKKEIIKKKMAIK